LIRDQTLTNNNFLSRKSQIAIEYCYRHRLDHPEAHIFWIHASNHARFTEAYHRIGKELGLSDVDNPEVDTLRLVQKWLSNDANGPWLLVMDNADDIGAFFGLRNDESAEQDGQQAKVLFKYLPQSSKGSMILTTRDKRIGQRLAKSEKPIDVLPFGMRDAKQLLQKTLYDNGLNDDHSVALLEALDFLPMAITQAAAFIRENDISVLEYLSYMRASDKEAKDLLAEIYHDPGRDPESRNSVFQTSRISFDCIRRQKPRAAEILSLMAVLDRQAIQKCLLRRDGERDIDFATAIGTLKAFSLITEERVEGTFGMHRLTQLSTQRWLELEGVIEVWQRKAMDVVSRLCTDDYVFSGDWKIWGSISLHAQVVLSFVFQSEPPLLERAVTLHRLAIHELEGGYIVNADARAHEALATIQKLEEDHPKKLAISSTVAVVLCRQGKFEAAEKIHRHVLEERRRTLGSNHPETLMSLDCVAATLAKQGKYEEAEALQRQLVEAWTTSPNLATHRFRFFCLTSLAYTLEMQCKYEEAEETIKKAIDGNTEVFGAKHPHTTDTLSLLSSVLMKRGKLEAAEGFARKALEDYKCSLGPQHRYTLCFIGHVAQILERQDKFEEAEMLIRPACEGLENLLGLEHQETIRALHDLAYTLVKQDKYQEAESSFRRAGCGRGDRSDSETRSTLSAMSLFAHVLEVREKWEEAEQLRRRAFRGFESLIGPEDEETLLALMALARVLGKRDKSQEAELVVRQALRICEDKFGLEGQPTLNALAGLAHVLGFQAKYEEAEVVSRRAFHSAAISFGPKHPFTVLCLGYLAFALAAQGKFETVIEVCRPLLDSYLEELDPKNWALPPLLDWVADALLKLRRYEEAELPSRQASEGYEEVLGSEDYYTLSALTKLAISLEHQGKLEAAEPIRRRILDGQEKILGPEHVDTVATVYALAWILHMRTQYDQASVLYLRACPGLQKVLGPNHCITIQCVENFAALNAMNQNRRHLSSRYFPRVRRIIRFLADLKAAQGTHMTNLSRQTCNS